MRKVLRQDRAKRPRIRFDHGMDVIDHPASTFPDEVVENLVLSFRLTRPIVGREPRDNARMRRFLRACLDRKVLDLHPLRIGRNVEIDAAESVTSLIKRERRSSPIALSVRAQTILAAASHQSPDAGDRGLTARACRRELSLSRTTRIENHVFTRSRPSRHSLGPCRRAASRKKRAFLTAWRTRRIRPLATFPSVQGKSRRSRRGAGGAPYAVRPFCPLLNPIKAVPAKPTSSMTQVDVSGTACSIPCAHRACTAAVGWTSFQ